jgi:HlyD family secretion protein
MKRWMALSLIAFTLGATGSLYWMGKLEALEKYAGGLFEKREQSIQVAVAIDDPVVTVVAAEPQALVEIIEVTGSIVAREEILVAPEISNQQVREVLVEEGDWVRKGQVLARLVSVNLDAQIAQNAAATQRAVAAIAQARSHIAQMQAAVEEADAALVRARSLRQQGHISQSVFDQRLAAARTAHAQLASARDGLRVAEAEKAQAVAQAKELAWRRENTAVTAPAAGVVSRRNAKVGAIANSNGEPMFLIIENGEIELKAEATEQQLAKIGEGQNAAVTSASGEVVTGRVRLISPEVDPATRLGHVRISIPSRPELRVGSFARARVVTSRSAGLAVPLGAVMYDEARAFVLGIDGDTVRRRYIETGLRANGYVEVRNGLAADERVVAKAGTFLRSGDKVRPKFEASSQLSKAN